MQAGEGDEGKCTCVSAEDAAALPVLKAYPRPIIAVPQLQHLYNNC